MRLQLNRPVGGLRPFASPEILVSGLEFLVLALLALQVAQLGWTIATPVTPLGRWEPAGPPVPVASGGLGSDDPFFKGNAGSAAVVVSALELTLLGTRVDSVSGRGSAIIATPDGQQASYLVGETVLPGVTLQAVAFDNVTLARGGVAENLFLDQSSGTPAAATDTGPAAPLAVPPATPTASPAQALGSEIAVTPRLAGGAVDGLVLSPKGNGAAFAAAGLRAGDVLISVDGRPVAEIGDPAAFAARLGSGATLVVERNGAPVTLRVVQ